MQDEINEKTIALYIKTGKLTAHGMTWIPTCVPTGNIFVVCTSQS